MLEPDTLTAIGKFVLKHRSSISLEFGHPRARMFNALFRMTYSDDGSAIIRFPKPGTTMFPEEKVRNEAAVEFSFFNAFLPSSGAVRSMARRD